ncbi:PREDICTED: myosin-binding protein 7 [Camelina sativa]|uniref:Myosin-binding protein 7 n=1 Tax=Camelina sativa TaxID=90675 RepID=A0ABM0V8N2_CAMSA|nr:PREDICTED: myosin-binding protein 7 [Camelina sativa]
MDLAIVSSSPRDVVRCCDCGCSCSLNDASPGSLLRSVKRKFEEFQNDKPFYITELELDLSSSNAKVQIENELELLRETVSSQQQSIQDLYEELDEERNAASTAASEAMSMILRLQRDKAELQMELRQFKRFAEEKMEHDQQELLDLEDLVYKREQTIQAMTCEAQAYKHRMMSFGLTDTEAELDAEKGMLSRNPSMIESDYQYDLPTYDYPPIKCNVNENPGPLEADIDVDDVEKYPLNDSPHGIENLKTLEKRISQMEKNPSFTQSNGDVSGGRNYSEKLMIGQSPRRQRHFRRVSTGSSSSLLGTNRETRPDFPTESPRSNSGSFRKVEDASFAEGNSYAKGKIDSSEIGDNDMNDRVYTIDSVHHGVSHSGVAEQKFKNETVDGYAAMSPREKLSQPDLGDPDIVKLYMRLQALEADRESMKQAIMSMRTEKAQMVLLKEIAQHLSKDVVPERRLPLRKTSIVGAFSFISLFKWITSFVLWRRKARRSKYMNGMQGNNMGLQMLLEKTPRIRQWRCLSSTQV